ncbi:MAG: tetratricopeptide repeat protein [Mesorhizobium sp.]
MKHLASRDNDPAKLWEKALAAYGSKDYGGAIQHLDKMLLRAPKFADAYYLLSVCHLLLNDFSAAEQAIRKALSYNKNAEYYSNLGLILQQSGNADGAAEAYITSLEMEPGSARACNNLANIYSKQGRFEEAIDLYRQALAYHPNYTLGHKNLGSLFMRVHRYEEAETALRNALALDDSFVEAKEMLGIALVETGCHDEAFSLFRSIKAWGRLQFEKRKIIDWNDLAAIDKACLEMPTTENLSPPSPWCLIQIPGIYPALEKQKAYDFAVYELPELKAPPICTHRQPASVNRPLRVGYLSADIYEHATTHLLAGVMEAHDRAACEPVIFSYSPKRDGMTDRLARSGLPIVNIADCSDQIAAREILQREIDILVDLKGFTTGARLGITALRPAPIIVSWLGYPGTLGYDRLADYIIGDPIVTPLEDAKHYSERLAWMPNCYQPNDRSRPLPPVATRAELGLPEHCLIFCSFNQLVKFNPQTFDIWSSILLSVPNSILWLLEPKSELARTNIVNEFTSRSIAAEP